ncbi:unnamed protein product [Paramecium pentaurelia]|uniref:Uncharacterized protein n=1 Tax=Paramecium pentaurelia TaxID=43138 RepID=A0A8S1TDJ2_9CILI|nr:unnamed protein product [Paramecium pentaurelia]
MVNMNLRIKSQEVGGINNRQKDELNMRMFIYHNKQTKSQFFQDVIRKQVYRKFELLQQQQR